MQVGLSVAIAPVALYFCAIAVLGLRELRRGTKTGVADRTCVCGDILVTDADFCDKCGTSTCGPGPHKSSRGNTTASNAPRPPVLAATNHLLSR
jgi:hypothetical protein